MEDDEWNFFYRSVRVWREHQESLLPDNTLAVIDLVWE